jgi:hypothetical protein
MTLPEYLVLFSNEGPVNVDVNFEEHDGSISNRKMRPNEIAALISTNGKGFHSKMTFDDWPFAVTKYEIDPARNQLTIFARRIP